MSQFFRIHEALSGRACLGDQGAGGASATMEGAN